MLINSSVFGLFGHISRWKGLGSGFFMFDNVIEEAELYIFLSKIYKYKQK
jgi:hypothetical protein